MKKTVKIIFLTLWIGLLAGMGLWYTLEAPRTETYDETENRNLAALPEISLQTFWDGGLSDKLETWLLDRFFARGKAMETANGLKDMASIATYEDSLAILQGSKDGLSGDAPDDSELGDMVSDLLNGGQTGDGSGEGNQNGNSEGKPLFEPKPAAKVEDFPENPAIISKADGKTVRWATYNRTNVLAVASVLSRVANLLPEGGQLVYTMVPQSYIANNYLATQNKTGFTSETEAIVHAFTPDNVTAFSTAEELDVRLKTRWDVYFRSDMHWSPLGTHFAYKKMMEIVGKEPLEWEDFNVQREEPFLGTYYRDNHTEAMKNNPDYLDLVTPKAPLEWRRITGKDEYKVIPILDFNARANDRYTVYLGGPAGPWTYAKTENGQTENCLVITDSFGLALVPMLAANYGETHYLDPRYYNYETVGYTVKEMIQKYNITDVFVVVGDLHSYNSDFLLKQLSGQIGD